jgi:hypothetical protein
MLTVAARSQSDLYRANLTKAYTKKNIQTTSSINMAPINNGGHTRWKIFATALRTNREIRLEAPQLILLYCKLTTP